jgi:diacylglycerol kinase family enzyme
MRAECNDRPEQPILIVNPNSGDGRAASIGLVSSAATMGVQSVTMQPGDDLAELAHAMVDRGTDHLMMAGGDGSLAIVAGVAIARGVAFSCVPVGTRNHFAMDLGLDRHDPLRSLDAARDGVERVIDVGMIANQVFVNNVSFGLYAQAIADPDYRSHRTRSLTDAAITMSKGSQTELAVQGPDGRKIEAIDMLLVSNNPYHLVGPPDFARRPSLETGTLGVVVSDRPSGTRQGRSELIQWQVPKLTVHAEPIEIRAGVDGELRSFEAPVEITIMPRALRVVVPKPAASGIGKAIGPTDGRAAFHADDIAPTEGAQRTVARTFLIRQLHEIDVEVVERLAGLESPTMDRLLPPLSEAASHSKIWMAMSIVMAVAGGEKGRRTAFRGLIAVGLTSLLANLVAKSLLRRSRPAHPVPEARSLPAPKSSSMPSGHTASAAAFAHVVGAAYPRFRIPLNILAAAIGFSRVYTGVHYLSDVAAGWFLGRGVGAMTLGATVKASMSFSDGK